MVSEVTTRHVSYQFVIPFHSEQLGRASKASESKLHRFFYSDMSVGDSIRTMSATIIPRLETQ